MKLSYLFFCLCLVNTSCQKQIQQFAYERNYYNRLENKQKDIDSSVYKIILPYKVKLDVKMNEVIGFNKYEMVKSKPASSLTNFITDATKEEYERATGKHLDVFIMNYGGIRLNSFGPGDVLIGEVFEIVPFENLLVVVQMKAQEVKLLFNKMAKSQGWPISKGSGFAIRDSMADDIIINYAALDTTKIYSIGLPDYVANGGDDTYFLKSLPREETGLLIRNLIIQYIKEKKILEGDESKRIKIIQP